MSTLLRLTLDEYERMVDEGAFEPLRSKRIELIRGELREMSPQKPPHHRIIVRLDRWSQLSTLPEEVEISVQCPLRIPSLDSEPEPDLYWAKFGVGFDRHPEPHEVFLVIEVARATLAYDLGEKALLYAEAGISDYWVVDVAGRQVHVLREPAPDGYRDHQQFAPGDSLRPLHFPHIELKLSELFAR